MEIEQIIKITFTEEPVKHSKFMQFCMDHKMYGLRGGGGGLESAVKYFPLSDLPMIQKFDEWFKSLKLQYIKVGSRVRYVDSLRDENNGNEGTVVEIIKHHKYPYKIKWDNDERVKETELQYLEFIPKNK